jgi:hypothetical protein
MTIRHEAHKLEIVSYYHKHGTDIWCCHPDDTTDTMIGTVLDYIHDAGEDAQRSILTLIVNGAITEALEAWTDEMEESFDVGVLSKSSGHLKGLRLSWDPNDAREKYDNVGRAKAKLAQLDEDERQE